ncbi:MAG: SCO family protein [Burkholderiales bacterium]
MKPPPSAPRRRMAAGVAAATVSAAWPRPSSASAAHGRLDPPRPAPDVAMTRDDGDRTTLDRLLRGRITAAHFMFTGCSSLCPVLAAVFAGIQERLDANRTPRFALLSISVDAMGETPASLQAWRRRVGAGDRWRAAVPRPSDADATLRWAAGGAPSIPFDVHGSQVLLLDPSARLVFRTGDLPRPEHVVRLMHELDAAVSR